MSDPPIQVEGVSKRYFLGTGLGSTEGGISAKLEQAVRRPVRKLLRQPPPAETQGEEFWALRDVSLEVAQGEVLGIIGRNGAGKSTLLKILAQITPPTSGRVVLRGQVGSLLEVGTGFHPELTGRENVYLNGAILGMGRKEIAARFDEIVEFSEIGKFLDTPVKRYSSGMYVRLAFAVSAHLLPEILLVDEVLAVGDAAFQRKCLEKMEALARGEGHTIIFVSHNTLTVREVANRIVLIQDGRVAMDGPSDQVVNDYIERIMPVQHGGASVIGPEVPRIGTGEARITQIALLDDEGELTDRIRFGAPFVVSLTVEVDETVPDVAAEVGVATQEGERFLTTHTTDRGGARFAIEPGVIEIRVRIDTTLYPGEYVIDAGLHNSRGASIDDVERILRFTALSVAPDGSDDDYPWEVSRGFVRPDSEWTVLEGSASAVQTSGTPTDVSGTR